ncbi:DUF6114 domain-containing protein [Streptomyces palmae]|uniref:Integral membrane protein n=1 Tax=Streptomyces palmae TaxID=1701085 RepID=A0A4Z0HDQ1_9ACTN|nr:DUF6114 domain-containing protein [Streptomyces palmae]TGB16158.1 hypothetical protein E4099_05740 [Streptomyces palmae]
MSAVSPGARVNRFTSLRQSFRGWRWQRPFWAGLITLLGGVPIAYFPYANLTMGQLTIRIATTTGSASLIIGVLLMVLGVCMWFQPAVRVFAGVAAILLGLVSLVVSNFGGFFMGFLLALFGGGMSVAWAPGETTPKARPAERAETAERVEAGDRVEIAEQAEAAEPVRTVQLVKAEEPVEAAERSQAGSLGVEDGEDAPEPAAAGTAPDQDSRNGRHRAGR